MNRAIVIVRCILIAIVAAFCLASGLYVEQMVRHYYAIAQGRAS